MLEENFGIKLRDNISEDKFGKHIRNLWEEMLEEHFIIKCRDKMLQNKERGTARTFDISYCVA